jgi:hypothetical protein
MEFEIGVQPVTSISSNRTELASFTGNRMKL